jgi:hypothetical protein
VARSSSAGTKVAAFIERRIADIDRLGSPNAPGATCVMCKDAELRRLLGSVWELAKRTP